MWAPKRARQSEHVMLCLFRWGNAERTVAIDAIARLLHERREVIVSNRVLGAVSSAYRNEEE